LGIDPGLERTGYAVIEWPAGKIREAGLIKSTVSTPLPERLGEIADGLEEVLTDSQVNLLVVEDLFAHYRHPRTAILMGHARGVLLLAAAKRNVEVISVPATRIKKMLTGNGHAGKLQVQRAVMATLGLRHLPEPADVADALAIACYGAWVSAFPRGADENGDGPPGRRPVRRLVGHRSAGGRALPAPTR
jgi:crossover junction endodeoxyribonuclease RuvC